MQQDIGQSRSLSDIIGGRPLFVSRWWGFRPDRWAAVCFRHERIVDDWISSHPQGGFVLAYASHHAAEHLEPDDRGRVFGVYEFAAEKIFYRDDRYIHPDYLTDSSCINDAGEFRWPFGLRAIRAWQFDRRLMTGGTLPSARSYGMEATATMVPIDQQDFVQVNKTTLHEVPVYKQPFRPMQLRQANAIPGRNYVFVCRDSEVLKRVPDWRHHELVIKPGIAFDVQKRLHFLNSHPIAQIFGFELTEYYDDVAPSFEAARGREGRMIQAALKNGFRLLGNRQQEFLMGNPKYLDTIVAVR